MFVEATGSDVGADPLDVVGITTAVAFHQQERARPGLAQFGEGRDHGFLVVDRREVAGTEDDLAPNQAEVGPQVGAIGTEEIRVDAPLHDLDSLAGHVEFGPDFSGEVGRVAGDEVGGAHRMAHVARLFGAEFLGFIDFRTPDSHDQRTAPNFANRGREMGPMHMHEVGPDTPEQVAQLEPDPAFAAALETDAVLANACRVPAQSADRYDVDLETLVREVAGPTLDVNVLGPADEADPLLSAHEFSVAASVVQTCSICSTRMVGYSGSVTTRSPIACESGTPVDGPSPASTYAVNVSTGR